VAPQVRGDRAERLPQVIERAVPVEGCRRHPAVDEQHGGRARRSRDLPGPGRGCRCAPYNTAWKAGRDVGRGSRLRTVSWYAASLGMWGLAYGPAEAVPD
jgi:hypothetical protein